MLTPTLPTAAIAIAMTIVSLSPTLSRAAVADKPLPPAQAREKIGATITVEMTVRSAKNRLERRGEIYLDSETDFRDKNNFAVVISKAGALSLKAAGIDDPATHFQDKTIRATGTVKVVDKVPRIVIDNVERIRIVESVKRN